VEIAIGFYEGGKVDDDDSEMGFYGGVEGGSLEI
jgi:hypothetical protein